MNTLARLVAAVTTAILTLAGVAVTPAVAAQEPKRALGVELSVEPIAWVGQSTTATVTVTAQGVPALDPCTLGTARARIGSGTWVDSTGCSNGAFTVPLPTPAAMTAAVTAEFVPTTEGLYEVATPQAQPLTVKWSTTLTLTLAASSAPYLTPVTATATIPESAAPALTGSVEFTLTKDGSPTPAVQTVELEDGTASASLRPPTAGDWTVTADVTPTNTVLHSAATASQTLTVSTLTPTVVVTPPAGQARIGTAQWTASTTQDVPNAVWQWSTLDAEVCTVEPTSGLVTYLQRSSTPSCAVRADIAAQPDRTTAAHASGTVPSIAGRLVTISHTAPQAVVGEEALLVIRAKNATGSAASGGGTATLRRVGDTGPGIPTSSSHWFGGGLPVTFTPADAGDWTVSGSFVPDSSMAEYDATPFTITFTVGKGSRTMVQTNAPAAPRIGDTWKPDLTAATHGDALTVDQPEASSSCTYTALSNEVRFTAAGECRLVFRYAANPNYADEPQEWTRTVGKKPTLLAVKAVNPTDGTTPLTLAVGQPSAVAVTVSDPASPGQSFAQAGTVRVCRVGVTPCTPLAQESLNAASAGRALLTFTPTTTHPLEVRVELNSATHDAPASSSPLSVALGTPTLSITGLETLDAQVQELWEAQVLSSSPVRPVLTTTGSCSIEDEGLPGLGGHASQPTLWATDYAIRFEEAGPCQIRVIQQADSNWRSPVPLDVPVTVSYHPTKVLLDLEPDTERLVDRDSMVPETRVRVRGVSTGTDMLEGELTVAVSGPHGFSKTQSLDQEARPNSTDADALSFELPLPAAGSYVVRATFAPNDQWMYQNADSPSRSLKAVLRPQILTWVPPASPSVRAGETWQHTFTVVPETDLPQGVLDTRKAVVSVLPDSALVCDVVGRTVEFNASGRCRIQASSPATPSHAAAPPLTVEFTVDLNPATVTVTVPPDAVVGRPSQVTLVSDSARGDVAGTYTLSDGVRTLPSVHSDDGEATFTWVPQKAGTTTLTVDLVPDRPTTFLPAHAEKTVVVAKAPTTTSVVVRNTTAVVTVTSAEGAGTPTGSVRLTSLVAGEQVASQLLTLGADGTATWANHGLDATSAGLVTADYQGDADRVASSASVERNLPLITATTSATTPAVNGWHRGPVQVTFQCTATTADLAEPCPAPVTLSGNGAAQRVTRSVRATDGAMATVASAPVNIDVTRPMLRITGPVTGAWYRGVAPAARCVATDAQSSVASCTLSTTKINATTTRISARAVDRAGWVSTAVVTFETVDTWVNNAARSGGVFLVKRGGVLRVTTRTTGVRPQLILATRPGRRPTKSGPPMVAVSIEEGVVTWTARYKLPKKFKRGSVVRIGVKARSVNRTIKVRIR